MPAQCENRPELATPTKTLISETWGIHSAGGGNLSLNTFFGVMGDLSPDNKQELQQRQAIVLSKSQDNGGTFVNIGPADIKVSWSDITLKISQEVGGTYVSLPTECRYIFDGNKSIRGCKWIFCIRIERLVGTANTLSIDTEGDSNDFCFTF